ncbi:MAG: dihydroorotate dehydrogenase electron transfer subunit [Termitinemataceae bacterium]|nr:MAG: dihydroorotate dehydrogenase electron transfer subunit [Termitinemataceae bacterium]
MQAKQVRFLGRHQLSADIFRLDFEWKCPPPEPGQFFLIKPVLSSVFLERPISVAIYENEILTFFITPKGKGTKEICSLHVNDKAWVTGPLGNTFMEMLEAKQIIKNDHLRIALISGGIGVAPLHFFSLQLYNANIDFDFYCGYRHLDEIDKAECAYLARYAKDTVIVTDDGSAGLKGRVVDFLDPAKYSAVFCCGPLPMMTSCAQKAAAAGTAVFASMEAHMACGVGACLGCTVRLQDSDGTFVNRRCCKDGPVFEGDKIAW